MTGKVSLRDYKNFLDYSMGILGMVLWVLICSCAAIFQLAVSLFLVNWANEPYKEQQKSFYPKTMILLIGIQFTICLIREFVIFNLIIRSASNMHQSMSETMVRAKIVFYDSNPIGRILTRFSKDMVVLDLIVPNAAVLISYGLFRTLSVVVALCIINVWLLIPLVFIVIYFIQQVRSAA